MQCGVKITCVKEDCITCNFYGCQKEKVYLPNELEQR